MADATKRRRARGRRASDARPARPSSAPSRRASRVGPRTFRLSSPGDGNAMTHIWLEIDEAGQSVRGRIPILRVPVREPGAVLPLPPHAQRPDGGVAALLRRRRHGLPLVHRADGARAPGRGRAAPAGAACARASATARCSARRSKPRRLDRPHDVIHRPSSPVSRLSSSSPRSCSRSRSTDEIERERERRQAEAGRRRPKTKTEDEEGDVPDADQPAVNSRARERRLPAGWKPALPRA